MLSFTAVAPIHAAAARPQLRSSFLGASTRAAQATRGHRRRYAAPVFFAKAENELVRGISRDGSISCRVLIANDIVREITGLQGCSPTAMAALGRTLCGALLLSDGKKDGESVQLDFRGSGPVGRVMGIADSNGFVRGLCGNPAADVPPNKQGKLDVGGLIGPGTLYVVRYHPSMKEPFTGIVDLVNGEVAEDILSYLVNSEQVPSALGLGVYVGGLRAGKPEVENAGGFLVQVLPGATDEELAQLEENVRALPATTELLRTGARGDDIMDLILAGGLEGDRERHRSTPEFRCQCDEGRVDRAIALLSLGDLEEMAEKDEDLEIKCEFCSKQYRLGAARLQEIVSQKRFKMPKLPRTSSN
eukprot:tig00021123_g18488.t1